MTVSGDTQPLAGVVVADFTRILAGPMCTMVLADLGADVIKIEHPVRGDETRAWGPPFVGDDAAYFLSVNRNKRSVALDLAVEADRELAAQVVDRADVVVENFRPGVLERFGLDFESARASNPGLVYCSMPAFTNEEMRGLPGYDLQMQAISGFMSITGTEGGEPAKMGVALLDVMAGLYSATAILAALRRRDATGVGERVEVGLFDASVASLVNQASNYLLGGVVPKASGSAHPNIVPYQAFRAADGWFVMAAAGEKQYRAACGAIGRPDLADDPRFLTNSDRVANRAELIATLTETFATDDTRRWVDALMAAGVPAGPVRSIEQVFTSPEGAAAVETLLDPVRGPLNLVRSPIRMGATTVSPPPRLGEHTAEVADWVSSTPPLGDRRRGDGV